MILTNDVCSVVLIKIPDKHIWPVYNTIKTLRVYF